MELFRKFAVISKFKSYKNMARKSVVRKGRTGHGPPPLSAPRFFPGKAGLFIDSCEADDYKL